MEKNLIIVRGLPGSGKNSVASLIGGCICSADDFLMENGEYIWDIEKSGKAHVACQGKCEEGMKNNLEKILIVNTSTTERELKPYLELAEKYNYKVFSIIIENRHGNISTHNVPEETIEKMKNRFSIKL